MRASTSPRLPCRPLWSLPLWSPPLCGWSPRSVPPLTGLLVTATALLALAGCGTELATVPQADTADTGSLADGQDQDQLSVDAMDTGVADTPPTDSSPDITDVEPGDTAAVDVAAQPPSCITYCQAVQDACGDAGTPTSQYESQGSCLTFCQVTMGWALGQAGDLSGDTLACRQAHALLATASPGAAATHCPAAGLAGAGVCGSWCDGYCSLAAKVCGDDNALFPSDADCAEACATVPPKGQPGDTTGDSIQCRVTQLVQGFAAPETHCPDAAPGVDAAAPGPCVDPAPNCPDYCALYGAACGFQPQGGAGFTDAAQCLAYCAQWGAPAPGEDGDTSGDTIGCRMTYAEQALQPDADKGTLCAKAGASGGDVCGSLCENYCAAATTHCGGDTPLYETPATCLSACAAWPTDGVDGATEGDTVQCRLTHALLAASDPTQGGASADPIDHCAQAAPDGGEACRWPTPAPTCTEYCQHIQSVCGDAGLPNAQYANLASCVLFCSVAGQLAAGTGDDVQGDTVGCRDHWATQAELTGDAATYCPMAGPSGGGVCGGWCDNYCHLALASCTGGNAVYADDASCQQACAALPASGKAGATTGDTVQCRLHYLELAGMDGETSATQHCPTAAPLWGGKCSDPQPSCQAYCETVLGACEADSSGAPPYGDLASCLSFCQQGASWQPGAYDDQDGDTIACRLTHARLAGTEGPAGHCDAAGATGGGVCGTPCGNFCDMVTANCGGMSPYLSPDECLAACQGWAVEGSPQDLAGDSFRCRLNHAALAGTGDASTHCAATAADGGPSCVGTVEIPATPSCAAYCALMDANCAEDFAQYESQDACLAFCQDQAALPLGTADDLDVDTVGCRIRHAILAVTTTDPASQCPAAGPTGGGVCGAACENYCALVAQGCGAAPLYADTEACLAACDSFPLGGAPGDEAGDSLSCRLTHAALAVSDTEQAASLHCPAAAADGGVTCVVPTTYLGDVQPVLETHCTPCHAGSSADTCAGGACLATSYADTQLPSYYCPGKTKGECALVRVLEPSMPLGALGSVPADGIEALQRWVLTGMSEQ